ncbi:MAG: hypothetical protein Kow0073_15840 [Immundisolibacter sp.]
MNSGRSGSSWLRGAGLLAASVALALAADSWLPLSGTRWEHLIWLPAAGLGAALAMRGLWCALTTHTVMAAGASARRLPRDPQAHLRDMRRTGGYWAVKLRLPDHGACEQALALKGRVFDLYHAPALPLSGCTNRRCKCGYAGLRERRRRDVLPPGLSKDRRQGRVLRWPGPRRHQ